MDAWMGGVGFLFMILYLAVVVGVVVLVLLSLWRSMRAQEEIARTLSRIEQAIARRSPPAA